MGKYVGGGRFGGGWVGDGWNRVYSGGVIKSGTVHVMGRGKAPWYQNARDQVIGGEFQGIRENEELGSDQKSRRTTELEEGKNPHGFRGKTFLSCFTKNSGK